MTLYDYLIQHIADELVTEPEPIRRDGLHAGQLHIIENQRRFNVIAAGRRFGKTVVAIQALKEYAAQGKRIWWTAQTYKAVNKVWRELSTHYKHERVDKTMKEIHLSNGGYIGVRSLNEYDNLRSEGLEVVFIDEAAFVSPNAWYDVLQAMLLDGGKDSIAWFMCNPKGLNWFYDLYALGNDDNEPDWVSFHFTSYDNPRIPPEEIDAIKRRTPARKFQEEYLAEFVDADGAVFRNVRTCATVQPQSEPVQGHNYVFAVDWGRDNDFTVIAIMDTTTAELVAIERFNQIDYTLQQTRLKSAYERWKPDIIIAESNAMGQPNIDALRRDGLPVRAFNTNQKSKASIIEGLALAFETEQIHIINHPVLVHELVSYEQKRTEGGAFKFSAPEGQHDDTVMALAIAWSFARRVVPDEINVLSF